MNRFVLTFGLLLAVFLSACDKPKETLVMTAKVNGVDVSYNVPGYALKSVFQYEDEAIAYNRYIINGLDGIKGGVFFRVIDSTASRTCFSFEDFQRVYYKDGTGKTCQAIDANLEITKEESDILCGNFNMLALNIEGDSIIISEGFFELSLEVYEIELQ